MTVMAVVLVETAVLQDSASHSRVPEASASPENLLEMYICGPRPSLIKSKTWSPAKQCFNETFRGF